MSQNLPCLRQCEKVMAYSCVEVWFEIGHEASERAKRTAEGFTHDWEVFVRGVDNADIHYFVEKVVFHLHKTFSRPKRVIKEPPYSVKESGYAGFLLPIEVYFKNKDDPKKVKYSYDLQLRYNGPPFTNIKKEKYTFSNPSEDFRRKLIRGGGVGVLGSEAGGNSVSSEKTCAEEGTPSVQPTVKHSTPTLAGKPKLTSDPSKKAKIKEAKVEELKPSNSFAELFGTPIKAAKVSPDPKKPSQSKVSPLSKSSKSVDKAEKLNSDKQYNASKQKHIPQKEIKKDGSSREDKGERKDKNKERGKEKSKLSPPKLSKEEPKKSSSGDHKEKGEAKSSEVKGERKKDKRAKDERVKKDKYKDMEKPPSEKSEKSEKHVKENKEKEPKKSPKHLSSKDVEKAREKEKHRDSERDKLRHKHKKKEKYKKGKEESREKLKKAEDKDMGGSTGREHHGEKRKRSESRSPSPSPQPSPILPRSPEKESAPVVKDKPSKHPLSALFEELEYHTSDSSSSHLSGDEDMIEPPKLKAKQFSSPRESKLEVVKEVSRVSEKQENVHVETLEPLVEDVKPSKHKTSSHKEKGSSGGSASKSKSKDKSVRKKEREGVVDSSLEEKRKKKRNKRSREEDVIEEPPAKEIKEEVEEAPQEKSENDSALKPPTDNTSIAKPKFSKEYVSELLDLQKKIMTIKDDTELQRVVQVLAQSGKYEINNKSFDVDLCALDKSTVKKLQEFFTVS